MAMNDDELKELKERIRTAIAGNPIWSQLQAIPMSEYVGIAATVSDNSTTTTGDNVWDYPRYYPMQPWTDTPRPWTTVPWPPIQPYTQPVIEFYGDTPLFKIEPETEVIESITGVQKAWTGEQVTEVKLRLPAMDVERLRELVPNLEAEFKLAVIRALQLIPSPQRARTLILEEEDND